MFVLREPWRPHPLAWIHRSEAGGIAGELGSGLQVFLESRVLELNQEPLLRLSDPVMLRATEVLSENSIGYIGPGAATMRRCYDKREANRIVAAAGIDCPAEGSGSLPLIVKPRRGSDSIGVRLFRNGIVPRKYWNENFLIQEQVSGTELTVAVLHGRAGMPLQIHLPEGRPYSFLGKYLLRPRRSPLSGGALAERVRHTALGIADLLDVDWAARIDFIHDPRSGRLCFLECDVAPLIGQGSAFAASLAAVGMQRAEQLKLLMARN